jgi:hypothetical protein
MMALTAAQKKAERIAAAEEARTAAFQASIPETIEKPLSQTEFDALIKEAEDAAAAGNEDFAVGNAMVAANKKVEASKKELGLPSEDALRIAEADRRDRQSAYDILYNQFNKYGLGTLVEDIKYLIQSNVSPSQFSLELQNTKAYQNRFAANKERIAKGLSALSPAEYIGLEDQYQNVMRNYGLPASYYTKDATGKQAGFEKFLAGDVSALNLKTVLSTAQKRVINANPEVTTALKQFYPDITNATSWLIALILTST